MSPPKLPAAMLCKGKPAIILATLSALVLSRPLGILVENVNFQGIDLNPYGVTTYVHAARPADLSAYAVTTYDDLFILRKNLVLGLDCADT